MYQDKTPGKSSQLVLENILHICIELDGFLLSLEKSHQLRLGASVLCTKMAGLISMISYAGWSVFAGVKLSRIRGLPSTL